MEGAAAEPPGIELAPLAVGIIGSGRLICCNLAQDVQTLAIAIAGQRKHKHECGLVELLLIVNHDKKRRCLRTKQSSDQMHGIDQWIDMVRYESLQIELTV